MDKREELNKLYAPLVTKMETMLAELKKTEAYKCTWGFFNNHSYKNEAGEYVADLFPIPVIEVRGLCDIEIDIEGTGISTKLSKKKALEMDYEKMEKHMGVVRLEVYGVEDYLADCYVSGEDGSDLGKTLKKMVESSETEFFFSFYFGENVRSEVVSKVVEDLKDMGAYY